MLEMPKQNIELYELTAAAMRQRIDMIISAIMGHAGDIVVVVKAGIMPRRATRTPA